MRGCTIQLLHWVCNPTIVDLSLLSGLRATTLGKFNFARVPLVTKWYTCTCKLIPRLSWAASCAMHYPMSRTINWWLKKQKTAPQLRATRDMVAKLCYIHSNILPVGGRMTVSFITCSRDLLQITFCSNLACASLVESCLGVLKGLGWLINSPPCS